MLEAKKCYEFSDDGFRCVPHGACKNGEIITTGAGLIDTRSVFFNPERSVCDKFTDVCCRLPEWKGKTKLFKFKILSLKKKEPQTL